MTITEVVSFIRPEIKSLKPYTSARSEYQGEASVYLDANENPFGYQNRYPDPLQQDLKQLLSRIKSAPLDSIFIGNGSDEAIDLILRIFCRPGTDKIIICPPTYGMYSVVAQIHGVAVCEVLLNENFQPDVPGILREAKELPDNANGILFLCSPNNPTGNLLNDIAPLIAQFPGIVVLDEAYIDFSPEASLLPLLKSYPNLIILQTLSKAWGLAAARIGLAFAHPEIIAQMNRVKMPYNVSTLNQKAAIRALRQQTTSARYIALILKQRELMVEALQNLSQVRRVYPSDANFLLVEFQDTDAVYLQLMRNGIIVRNRSSQINQTLRITIGTPEENAKLLSLLGNRDDNLNANTQLRYATVSRKTNETVLSVILDIDGSGEASINTGIGFFDHMLEQLTRHSKINLSVSATGDLFIDEHHTVEDTALALGEAFQKALGEKRGIQRYGFLLPMDDCLAQVAIDFSGRPWTIFDATFNREKIGELPTELFSHFFKSFADKAQCNLNIKAEGENEHHKIEAIFKAFGKAIRMAVTETGSDEIPSTKGIL